jgi:hypothetical protein
LLSAPDAINEISTDSEWFLLFKNRFRFLCLAVRPPGSIALSVFDVHPLILLLIAHCRDGQSAV